MKVSSGQTYSGIIYAYCKTYVLGIFLIGPPRFLLAVFVYILELIIFLAKFLI